MNELREDKWVNDSFTEPPPRIMPDLKKKDKEISSIYYDKSYVVFTLKEYHKMLAVEKPSLNVGSIFTYEKPGALAPMLHRKSFSTRKFENTTMETTPKINSPNIPEIHQRSKSETLQVLPISPSKSSLQAVPFQRPEKIYETDD